jgi:hypothetical protein
MPLVAQTADKTRMAVIRLKMLNAVLLFLDFTSNKWFLILFPFLSG